MRRLSLNSTSGQSRRCCRPHRQYSFSSQSSLFDHHRYVSIFSAIVASADNETQALPLFVPLPPSPSPSTPSVSMRVSLSTPRGDTPSIASNLETVATDAPSHILTHDVNRLLQYLHDVNEARGAENKDLADNIQDIKGTLEDLEALLRDRMFPERPPPVPHKDIAVGGSIISSRSPRPQSVVREVLPQRVVADVHPGRVTPDGRPIPRIVRAISISPPPMRGKSPPSPASLSESMSFLSSHHSDDLSLMESESYPMEMQESPSWPSSSPVSSPESSTSSSPVSAPPSSLTPTEQLSELGPRLSVPIPLSLSPSPTPPPLSSSPSPSTLSSVTARPVQTTTLSTFRYGLDAVRQQIAALREQQDDANRQLEDLRSRPREMPAPAPPPPVDHWDDFSDRLRLIEQSILRLLQQSMPQQPRAAPPESVREPDAESSVHTDWRSIIDGILNQGADAREPPLIHAPGPIRPAGGLSFDEELMSILTAQPPSSQQQVHPPPPLIPLIYRPGPRVRPRSTSPPLDADLPPRPGTFPPTQPPMYMPSARVRVPRHPAVRPIIRQPVSEVAPSEVETQADLPAEPATVPRPAVTPRPGEGPDINFLREVQRRRGGDGFVSVEQVRSRSRAHY